MLEKSEYKKKNKNIKREDIVNGKTGHTKLRREDRGVKERHWERETGHQISEDNN